MQNERGHPCCLLERQKRSYHLTNMHEPPASGHYVDEEGSGSKPLCIEIYNRNMGLLIQTI
jgi:hypothetical protein